LKIFLINTKNKILITGISGFIGYHVASYFLNKDYIVYGELGRPDMFIPKIINNLKTRKFIQLYNNGNHYRDFTYVGDVSKIIFKLSNANFLKNKKNLILNICSGKSISIIKIIKLISQSINIKPLVKKLSF